VHMRHTRSSRSTPAAKPLAAAHHWQGDQHSRLQRHSPPVHAYRSHIDARQQGVVGAAAAAVDLQTVPSTQLTAWMEVHADPQQVWTTNRDSTGTTGSTAWVPATRDAPTSVDHHSGTVHLGLDNGTVSPDVAVGSIVDDSGARLFNGVDDLAADAAVGRGTRRSLSVACIDVGDSHEGRKVITLEDSSDQHHQQQFQAAGLLLEGYEGGPGDICPQQLRDYLQQSRARRGSAPAGASPSPEAGDAWHEEAGEESSQALSQQITDAVHWQDIRVLYEVHEGTLSTSHVVAMLHRLAELAGVHAGSAVVPSGGLLSRVEFQELQELSLMLVRCWAHSMTVVTSGNGLRLIAQ